MKMQTAVNAEFNGVVASLDVAENQTVQKGTALVTLTATETDNLTQRSTAAPQTSANNLVTPAQSLEDFYYRVAQTGDQARKSARDKRHRKGFRTARENLEDLCDTGSFQEYGQFAVAAQRNRRDYETLKSETAGDGIITGVGTVNSDLMEGANCRTAIVINDYGVLAGTQGFYHHQKLDRLLEIAERQQLPIIMYAEGGGGRPGDTDITNVNSALNTQAFASWARLQGCVPRISVVNGYCFAGNAALFGAADITIATHSSYIGMAGPAMIEGGGLGSFKPTEIGPIEVQSNNGVVDIVAEDEAQATAIAKQCLAYFQGATEHWQVADQAAVSQILPDDRRYSYDVRKLITTLVDQDSMQELKPNFGGALVTALVRIEGRPLGVIASNCRVNGGAIDVDAADKAAAFQQLCNQFDLPILCLCDTPGFMVGPAHEQLGAVRRLSSLFVSGAQLRVPLIAVVLRKCYGLGAQALLGGSTSSPLYTMSWPTGEFGAMGPEGAVKLGFRKELEAQDNPEKRQALFQQLLAEQFYRGQATEVATSLEIDAVIDPVETRQIIAQILRGYSRQQEP
jgi:acetyl-CoA carboxylase carboxyltransferase component